MNAIVLNGHSLTPATLREIGNGGTVAIDPACPAKIQAAWTLMQTAVEERWPVYGVTTGLGPQAVVEMPDTAIDSFSLSTLRGRAHALGPAMPGSWVRAAMAVRLNTLLIGATSVRPALADYLRDCINLNLIPVIGESASIGAADLLWGATCGLALCGEGTMVNARGEQADAGDAIKGAGLEPWQPAPREGLALASHSGFSAAIAALGIDRAEQLLNSACQAAALSMLGFQANLSPLNEQVLSLRPQPGQALAAQRLRESLAGSHLFDSSNARRLQDPLSIRNAVQVLGAAFAALQFAKDAIHGELNGTTDNPASLSDSQQIISHGGYLAPLAGIALNALAQALATLAAQLVARISKLLNERFSGLPTGLKPDGADTAGLAPLMKVAEALMMEIGQLAQAPTPAPSPSADSLEDCNTNAPLTAKLLVVLSEKLTCLIAIELLVATHAIRLRGSESVPAALTDLYRSIAATSPVLDCDRSLSNEIHHLVDNVLSSACGQQRTVD